VDLELFEQYFAATFGDQRLSRGERSALKALVEDLDPTPEQRLELVGRAFATARGAAARARPGQVLTWLEAVVRLLLTTAGSKVADAVFAPHQDCALRLRKLFDAASRSVDVCVFTITDDRITRAILRAHQRGVALRIVSDDLKAFDLGSDVHRLAEAGVALRVDRSEDHMHHKFAIFDQRLLVTGSYNWTRSAAERNRENLAVTDDRRLVTAFGEEFERLWTDFGPSVS
jgi:phosphatidylserine/phosphatidylglycerophosphate/cardiolipin synthase-like enzyme